MGKKAAKVKEGHTKEERKELRKGLGSLKSLTVQPVTKARYQHSLDLFFKYLREEGLSLPTKRDRMDDLVSDYLEHLWSEGEGRAAASTFLAALQDFDPKLRGHLPGSWRLMRTWTSNEIPNRAPPLTESVLKAMYGWCVFHEYFSFGLSLLVAFYTLMRTGELLALQAWQIHMTSARVSLRWLVLVLLSPANARVRQSLSPLLRNSFYVYYGIGNSTLGQMNF